ncbi:MarR family winged helix-turn-helix transcriptional regulator [Radiobacillus deserti]|uniref:MarR family transcriptional regulator n=1 Tax=Radiobacillus deserti TaxID=2594883 RepID=A0A516KE83_9BACI|nr:MarR family transcriptional regulator [Radiobacillus deserti]QDP39626.1 MarR family transcriptional regulator [Radiobacillus deserti]
MNKVELHELIELYTSTMNEVNRRVNVIMNDEVHQELTTDQFATLRFLAKHEPTTSTEIANEFSIGKSAVTAQVNRLFERELLERERDEQDRRIVYLRLTSKGRALVEEGTEKLYDVLGDILTQFSQEEVTSFVQSLQKLVTFLREK